MNSYGSGVHVQWWAPKGEKKNKQTKRNRKFSSSKFDRFQKITKSMAGYKIESAWDLQCKSSNYRVWASRVTRLAPCRRVQNKNQQQTRGGREHRQTEEWIMRLKASEHERETETERQRVLSQERIVGRMSVRAPGEFESLHLRQSVDFGGNQLCTGCLLKTKLDTKKSTRKRASNWRAIELAREQRVIEARASERAIERASEQSDERASERGSNRRASERGMMNRGWKCRKRSEIFRRLWCKSFFYYLSTFFLDKSVLSK
jgi:hypothetical protein